MPPGKYLAVLKQANYRRLFLAQATSVVGDDIATIALAFAVLDLTGSAADLGFVIGARTLPMVLFLLIGGVWADRVSRVKLMVSSDLGRFATQAATATLLITGSAELWHLVALQAVNGSATAFFRPAATGLTPATVGADQLQQANALLSFTVSASGIVGAAIAGILVTLVGSGWAMAVDALTFLASAVFLTRLSLPTSARTSEPATFVADLREGWSEVISRSWVWLSIASFMAFQLLVLPAFFVLGPARAHELPNGAARWSIVIGAAGIGSLVGDVIALRIRPRRPLRAAYLVGLLVTPALVLLGASEDWGLIAAAAVPFGIGFSVPNTLWFTALQRHVPEHVLSRVSSYDWMGSTLLRPVGYWAVGPVAAVVGAGATLIAAAAAIAAVLLGVAATPAIGNLVDD